MVEGFAETERKAHYEIATLILSKRNSSKRNTRIIKRNTESSTPAPSKHSLMDTNEPHQDNQWRRITRCQKQ